jgi:predicted dehydrogenase
MMNEQECFEPGGVTRRKWLQDSARTVAGLGLLGAISPFDIAPAEGAEYGRAAHTATVTPEIQPPDPSTSANEKYVLAVIGSGGMGRSNLRALMNKPNVEIAAICDPDTGHMAQGAKMVEEKFGKRPQEIKDFRKVLEMKDVDGVIVSTPDHWHALPTMLACEVGKDVFCEKPISHNIVEGRAMVKSAEKYKRVVQVNTWQRSTQHFIDAIDYVRSGKLGRVTLCRAWKVQEEKAAIMGSQSQSSPPDALDYDMWVGPAAWEPYQENRCHYRFRWYFNYAGGMTGDWGVHMMDIILLGMSKDKDTLVMPTRIASYGGKYFVGEKDDRTTPDTQIAIYEFPGWLLQWEVHIGGQGLDGGRDHGAIFIGTEGRVLVDRRGWTITDKAGNPVEKPMGTPRVGDHPDDWLTCIRTRQQPRSDIASMHATTTVCHLANLAYLAGGAIDWDPVKESVTNNKKAMDLLPYRREYRKPWSLPKV